MSLEETQQPSYHVKAASLRKADLSRDKSDGDIGESVGSLTSEARFIHQQQELNSAEHSKQSQIRHLSIDQAVIVDEGREGDQGDGVIGRQSTDEGADSPSITTPPDSYAESGPRPLAPVAIAISGPSARRPVSEYSPKKLGDRIPRPPSLRKRSNDPNLLPDRPTRREKHDTPRNLGRSTVKNMSQDSFGDPAEQRKVAPIARFTEIMESRSDIQLDSPHSDTEDESQDGVEDEGDSMDADGGIISSLKVQRAGEPDREPDSPDPDELGQASGLSDPIGSHPIPIVARSAPQEIIPLAAGSSPVHRSRSPSALNRGTAMPSPPPQPRFQALPASRSASSQDGHSRLFSSQADNFDATQRSTRSMHFAATQAISDENPLMAVGTAPVVLNTPSIRDSSGPSVPAHRRLGPTTPRKDPKDTPGLNTESTSMRSPARKVASRSPFPAMIVESQKASSSLRHHESYSSSIADDPCLQPTFVDDLGVSSIQQSLPPFLNDQIPSRHSGPQNRAQPAEPVQRRASPRRLNASPAPRLAVEAVPADNPNDDQTPIEDDMTLKSPAAIRTTPRQYKRKRKTPPRVIGPPQLDNSARRSGKESKRTHGVAGASQPEIQDSDSSSAPEDVEDNTYRPAAKAIKSSRQKRSSARNRDLNPDKPTRTSRSSGSSSVHPPQAATTTSRKTSTLTTIPTSTPAMRPIILAWWTDRSYYPGIAAGRDGDKVRVDFLDDSHASVAVNRLRRCELRKGELVKPRVPIKGVGYKEVEIEQDWRGEDERIKVSFGNKHIGSIALKDISLRQVVIDRSFGDRLVTTEELGFPSPSPLARVSSPVKRTSRPPILGGRVFLSSGLNTVESKEFNKRIVDNGGKVVQEWMELFNIPRDGFGSSLSKNEAPFLLVHGGAPAMSVKMMAALARGIPCLSAEYVDAAIHQNASWHGFLIAAGQYEQMELSQLVDLGWGRGGWKARTAVRPIRPFIGKAFLFVEPQSSDQIYKDVKALVPFCVHALGVDSLAKTAKLQAIDTNAYDCILYEDRLKQTVPAVLNDSGKLCNIAWLKQCIITNSALPPAVL